MTKIVEVVAGVLFNELGQCLLSSRPAGKPYAGYWEFAGGKVEAGESAFAALQREFAEELGVEILAATPWLCKRYDYEHAKVRVRFFRVAAHQWQGSLHAREGQTWRWQTVGQFDVSPMLPANTALLRALAFPTHWQGDLAQEVRGVGVQAAWRLLPYSQATLPQQHIWLSWDEWQDNHLNKQDFASVWVRVHRAEQARLANHVDGIIWQIDDATQAQAACTYLQDGSEVPVVLASDAVLCARFGDAWRDLGAQAVLLIE